MTLVGLWIRKNKTLQEMVAVSDSRISGGESWDRCPKLIALPRPATAIAMSGDATTAYAFLLQANNACLLLDGNNVGRTDIKYVAEKLRDVYTESRSEVGDLPIGQEYPDIPDLDVVLFGWSWRNLCFKAYSFKYNRRGEVIMTPINFESSTNRGAYFAGDAGGGARGRLKTILTTRGVYDSLRKRGDQSVDEPTSELDWEPLEILQEFIQNPEIRTVGGVPQILRIYQYGATEQFVWRDDSGDYFGGRRIGGKERFDRRVATYIDGSIKIQFSDRSISNETETV